MNLSPNFELSEFIESPKAHELGIINNPQQIHIDNLTRLCVNVLEPIRAHFKRPIKIMSGYRCPALNDAVEGAKTSQHLSGEAADIEVQGVDNADVWRWIDENLQFDQVIAEHLSETSGVAGWIHVSYNQFDNRGEALSCIAKGKYVEGLHFV
ncbi:Peptidase M15A, C-terminal [uncultured Caudovirales phage]|uniref:Peptidase M15A, C-terminal n=1 Tax=uncultured Caudovirales phage TaxID=2100421 RepID=A0A6J7WGJ5_9CAUD|nr:Peptidase M15A, C-terminal [uncultured Caudovirales phage]